MMSFLKSYIKNFTAEQWNVGFILNDIEDIIAGGQIKVDWIKHNYRKSWFADPFILDVTDKEIILLVEEFYKPIGRGRISKLVIDKTSCKLIQLDVVLELPTHLSFPVIIRPEDESSSFVKLIDVDYARTTEPFVYLMPENGESGYLSVYKYYFQSNKIDIIGSVLDEPVEDAVPINIDNEIYLFCTPRENPNGNILQIFQWSNGKRKFEKVHTLTFEENIARMSGMFFPHNKTLVRPTQECNTQYGHAITLQKFQKPIDSITSIDFKEVRRIYSVHPSLTVGSHTFNIYKGIIVTDALGFDRMWIRKMIHYCGLKKG
uniref:Glucosamine inositolphosphorylceramide transferase 1 N-terminal domain-containing protein n=1 Tax=Prevotella sp. GTC17254 TaxID=3236794 RepID=A0AB33J3E2_9BACT